VSTRVSSIRTPRITVLPWAAPFVRYSGPARIGWKKITARMAETEATIACVGKAHGPKAVGPATIQVSLEVNLIPSRLVILR
jgi:hypothetical protein